MNDDELELVKAHEDEERKKKAAAIWKAFADFVREEFPADGLTIYPQSPFALEETIPVGGRCFVTVVLPGSDYKKVGDNIRGTLIVQAKYLGSKRFEVIAYQAPVITYEGDMYYYRRIDDRRYAFLCAYRSLDELKPL